MQPFSQKIVAVANVLVLTFKFFLFALEQHKKTEEKSNLIQFHTEPKKCTGQNYWMPSPNCCFEISPQVFYGIQIWTLLAISELSSALFVTISECFLKCVSGHCPAGRPVTSGGDAAFWHWPLRCAPKFFGNHQISWYRSLAFFMPLCQQWCPPGSPTIASLFIQMATDSASWHYCTLCLQISLNLFGS